MIERARAPTEHRKRVVGLVTLAMSYREKEGDEVIAREPPYLHTTRQRRDTC